MSAEKPEKTTIFCLIHLPLVPHICVGELGQYWFMKWLVACSAPSHFLNQCCLIVKWTLTNKFQWNFIKTQKFSFVKMHLKMSSAKWRPFCPGEDDLGKVGYNSDSRRRKIAWGLAITASQFSSQYTSASDSARLKGSVHDVVIKWKHFPRYWPFVRGIHRPPVNSPHKGQWGVALIFSLICTGINDWVNNGEAGDLRRHRAHHDVTVMYRVSCQFTVWLC